MSIDTLRDEILVASLPNVVFDGWSLQSLRDGTQTAGHEPSALLRAFPAASPMRWSISPTGPTARCSTGWRPSRWPR